MAGRDLGEGTRLAAETGAYVCFEDEAGQDLRPPEARTWARRGHTPVVTVCGKGPGRVPVAGLVCLKPGSRGHLFYRVRIHRGRKGERRSIEGVWANMKNGLGNLAARDVDQPSPRSSRTGSRASSTGRPSSRGSSPRPD